MSRPTVPPAWVRVIVIEPGPVSTQRARIQFVTDMDAFTSLIGPEWSEIELADGVLPGDDVVMLGTHSPILASRPGSNEVANMIATASTPPVRGRAVITSRDPDGNLWDLPPGSLATLFRVISDALVEDTLGWRGS